MKAGAALLRGLRQAVQEESATAAASPSAASAAEPPEIALLAAATRLQRGQDRGLCPVEKGTIHKGRPHGGGGGVWPKSRYSEGGCVNLVRQNVDKREGVQNPKYFVYVLYEWSQR